MPPGPPPRHTGRTASSCRTNPVLRQISRGDAPAEGEADPKGRIQTTNSHNYLLRHDIYGRSGRGRRAAVAGVPLTNLNLVSARALLPPSHSGTGNPVPHSASIPPTPVHHTRCDPLILPLHHTLVACAHSRTPTSPHPPTTPPSARILVACAHSRTPTSPHHHDCLDALTRVPVGKGAGACE